MKPLTAAALLLAFPLAACNPPKEVRHDPAARPVLVAQMHFAPRETSAVLPGILRPRVESDLGFRVAGRIERRLVDIGATVKKGDALARLDETDFKLQVDQADAELDAANSARAQAEAEEKRFATLNRQGWAASADFDKIKSAADQARSTALKAERAATLARNALGYATLTADADGVVSAVMAEPGQVVAGGAPVVRLAHTDELEAAVAIPENMLARARTAPARVEFWTRPGVSAPVTLRELSPSADPATRTYAARFSLADKSADSRLGMSVTVTLADEGDRLAQAPIGAVFDIGHGPEVWRVDRATGQLTETPVKVAAYDSQFAFIVSGLAEGAEIVALGVHKLDAGEKVRIVENLAGL